ncbi:TDT family transporter [Williamsia sterculiae]|uniref:Tellurite resistance protein TehA n=1 Tax=Williamsia sterculiae TaxID=1344003 RepID=A0A1N7F5L1_9NOCA|nr:TDT family transporter [Williamsia sterculiae]SIR95613.1 Tellurite resistance protein TehA [Williamsia sterculiae]
MAFATHRQQLGHIGRERRRPSDDPRASSGLLGHLTPNWFASVMGTGIVANAAATLPVRSAGLRDAAVVIWMLAAVVLAALTVGFVVHWVHHRANAVGYLRHPVMVHFYGAPPMALLTVGAGAVQVGPTVFGATAMTTVFVSLWILGTVLGVATCLLATARILNPRTDRTAALPAWLMPVVPPMVSASTGSLLIPVMPAGPGRLMMLAFCYALFALSAVTGAITLACVVFRLARRGLDSVQAAPTMWITLGIVGQSTTAANLLAARSRSVVEPAVARWLEQAGMDVGIVMGFVGAVLGAVATIVTVRAARTGLRFSLAWWSFTFPVGTCVTGMTAWGSASGSTTAQDVAVMLFGVLVVAWLTVATYTIGGSVSGRLFFPSERSAAGVAGATGGHGQHRTDADRGERRPHPV